MVNRWIQIHGVDRFISVVFKFQFMEEVERVTDTLLRSGVNANCIEIEARIRGPIVSSTSIDRLLNSNLCTWKTQEYQERQNISKSNRKCTYRHRDYGVEHSVICKSSIATVDFPDAWCTVHVSTEINIPSMQRALFHIASNKVTRFKGKVNDCWVDISYDEERGWRIEVESRFYQTILNTVMLVCGKLQDSSVPIGRLDWTVLTHLANTRFATFCIAAGAYQKPKTMVVQDVWQVWGDKSDQWRVTPKLDGERRFVLILDDKAFSIDLVGNIRFVCDNKFEISTAILDCEYLDNTYHVIDVVVYKGKYVGDMDITERIPIVCSLIDVLQYQAIQKIYYEFESFQSLQKLYEKFILSKIDGMIFINVNKPYMQTPIKWKMESTVDLAIVSNDNRLELFTSDGVYITHIPLTDIEFRRKNNQLVPVPGIWEFRRKNNQLVPVRCRPDKPQANSYAIVQLNLSKAVPGTVFNGIGCYMMRKYHNAVKRRLLAGCSNAVILDIGTGQGGDVPKWKRASKVHCVEPNESCADEIYSRYGTVDNITMHNCLLRDLEPSNIPDMVSLFTAFFCMNQWNKQDFDNLERVINAKGSRKCTLLAIALTEPWENRNGCWTLIKTSNVNYTISIHNTRIVNIHERVVNVNRLDTIMKRCNMYRINKEKLNQSHFMTINELRLSGMYTQLVYKRTPLRF